MLTAATSIYGLAQIFFGVESIGIASLDGSGTVI
jgi:hypothetical protein